MMMTSVEEEKLKEGSDDGGLCGPVSFRNLAWFSLGQQSAPDDPEIAD